MRIPVRRSPLLLSILLTIPQTVWACPSCMGRDDQGYLLKIMLPVGLFLLFPFVIFGVLFCIARRIQNRQKAHEA